jgi:hypothetical protein
MSEVTIPAGQAHQNGGPGTSGVSGAAPDSFAERFRGVVAVVAAVLLLLSFAALVIFLVGKAGSATEGTWSRFVYLFGAAEALVFTAVGWLFGREVHRQAAQSAEARADQATTRAESATSVAADQEARGRALKAAVEARARLLPVEERGIGSGSADEPTADDVRQLAEFARILFPDR